MELNQSSDRLRRNFLKGWSRLQMSPRRLSLLGVAGAILIALLYQNSLIAFGIAPILISLLPCVLMCAMGLCMRGCSDRKCSDQPVADNQPSAKGSIHS